MKYEKTIQQMPYVDVRERLIYGRFMAKLSFEWKVMDAMLKHAEMIGAWNTCARIIAIIDVMGSIYEINSDLLKKCALNAAAGRLCDNYKIRREKFHA